MNDDLISREALRKAFTKSLYYFDQAGWDEANKIIDSAPPAEGPCGEWVSSCFSDVYICSVCGRTVYTPKKYLKRFPFCHCGADMRPKDDGSIL